MLQVVINSDDLGLNPTVNTAISKALAKGYVTSATILANSQYWDSIHEIIKLNPQASFGVHLNLTEGKALTENKVFLEKGIVDNRNNFTAKIREQDFTCKALLEAVYEEWDAQMYKVICEEGVHVTHVDGHHHIHADYVFHQILIDLLQKYKIAHVRNRYVFPVDSGRDLLRKTVRSFASPVCYRVMKSSLLNKIGKPVESLRYHIESALWTKKIKKYAGTSSYFDSYEHFINQMATGAKLRNKSVIELMVHPGHPKYINEYNMLASNMLHGACKNFKIVSYKDLQFDK